MNDAQTIPHRHSYTDQLARYFRARPGRWISALALQEPGGRCDWRGRISDLRDPPYGMLIENRMTRARRADGSVVVHSEYRWRPPAETTTPKSDVTSKETVRRNQTQATQSALSLPWEAA